VILYDLCYFKDGEEFKYLNKERVLNELGPFRNEIVSEIFHKF
jgi:hypothetical protein